jgi:hypothetical protein
MSYKPTGSKFWARDGAAASKWILGDLVNGEIKNPSMTVERIRSGRWKWETIEKGSSFQAQGLEDSMEAAMLAACIAASGMQEEEREEEEDVARFFGGLH